MTRHRLMRLGVALGLLGGGSLGGCSLGPAYQRPAVPVPAAYRAAPRAAPAAAPAPEWWRGFGSTELDGLIADARAHSFDIAAAIARVRQADAALRTAGSPLLPTVGVSAKDSWQRSFSSLRGKYAEQRTYSVLPSLSYEIDFWGRLRAGQAAAQANALFSRFDQQTVVLTTTAAVASAWFQALALQDRLAVARRNLGDAEQILQAIRARMAAGTASLLDVSQQETLVAGIRAQIPSLQSQLEQQIAGLGVLVGRPPEEITVRTGTLTALTLPPVAPGLPSALLARRPDIAAAEAQLVAANANIQVARADFFPQITLSGTAGWQNIALGTLFGPGSFLASLAGNAAQTIFDNGAKQGAYEQAKGRYDELLADYRKAVVQAFTDVDNGVTAYRYATAQEALARDAVATAQRAADIARAQLLAGTSDLVTALQAQTTLFTDLDNLAQVRLARFQALLGLYKALGGGWSAADVAAPASPIFNGVL
ncbi:MAG: efflux transporter outer membrane subunit [Rhodospirillales bacterium]|nr:efflux transporter outer membrane subunit [Rhodospirillales bacterium]